MYIKDRRENIFFSINTCLEGFLLGIYGTYHLNIILWKETQKYKYLISLFSSPYTSTEDIYDMILFPSTHNLK